MTVTERCATSRYYCLMPVHARGGLTVTALSFLLSQGVNPAAWGGLAARLRCPPPSTARGEARFETPPFNIAKGEPLTLLSQGYNHVLKYPPSIS